MYSDNYQSLLTKLDEFIRKYYKNQLIRGIIYTLAVSLIFYLMIAVLEYYAHFNTLIRTLLFYFFIAINGFIILRLIIAPLLKLNKFGKIISYEDAANVIGKHFTEVQDKLINVLQLQQQYNSTSSNSTFNIQHSSLVEASISQKIKQLKPVPFIAAIDLTQNKKYAKYALIPLLLTIVIFFIAPKILTDGTKRLIQHQLYFEKEAPFQFTILNTELKTLQQQDFELKVKLTGDEIPENVFIKIDENEYQLEKDGTVNFNYTFKNMQHSIKFNLYADGFNSKEYELIALPNPVLVNFNIELHYPAYIGKKDETIKNTGDIAIPSGTKVSWNFNTQNTNVLSIRFNDTLIAMQPTGENEYSYSSKFFKDKHYSLNTANTYLKSKDSVSYTISVIPDLYPTITLEEKPDSLSSRKIYFMGNIKDDYGFTKLTFNYKFVNATDSLPPKKLVEIAIPFNPKLNPGQFYHFWDLTSLAINPGDEIEYYFEVWDNDGVNGNKSAKSTRMIYKAPTTDELAKKTEKNNDKIKTDLEKSILQARLVQKELADLNRKVMEKKTLNWEDKKRLKELIEKQNELQDKVENIQNENEKNNREQSEFKENDQRIAEKQKQLEELFKTVMNEEMKEKMKELEKLMDQLDKEKVQQAIEKMKMDNKDIEKALDRNLEIFKQLEVEQKLQQNIDKLNELAQKQDKEAEKSQDKNANSKQQEEKQKELNKEFEQVKNDIKEMEKKNSELSNPNSLKSTETEQKQAEEEMKKSEQDLKEGKTKKASQSQKNASKKIQELSEKMAQMQKDMEQENNGEDMKALRDILENLVQLSFNQEALMGELSKTKIDNPNYPKIAQTQKKLHDDAQMVEDSLFALSKRNPKIQQDVNKEITQIEMSMEMAIAALAERQSYEASSRQQYSMTAINNLALMLNESLSNMQEAQKKQNNQAGTGSCNKPGGEGKKKSNASMTQLQQQLNKQIQQLKEAMEKGGKKPGQKPGQKQGTSGGEGDGMSEQLAKLAAQQEAIRREIQKMSQENNKNGKGGNGMNKMIEEMEKTENDLVNKMITQETINRQQEILTKLLESEKAEQEREMDEKRQSNEAKDINYRNLSQFFEYKRQKEKEVELLKTIPPSLSPFYKSKVNEYFSNFNL